MTEVQVSTGDTHTAQSFAAAPWPPPDAAAVACARSGPERAFYDDGGRAGRPIDQPACRSQEEPMTGTPTRRSGWPVLRTPRWMLAGAVVLVAGLTLAALPHHPSISERATDLRGAVQTMNADIESCAGGVSESLTALRAIQAGTSHDVKTAVGIATFGAQNCSPANSMPMDDLVQYQPPESLASFHLEQTVNDLVTWGFPDAQRVQSDVATLLTASTKPAIQAATTALQRDQRVLDAERATIDGMIEGASKSLSANVAPPSLPS
jgi:hypothetical protein